MFEDISCSTLNYLLKAERKAYGKLLTETHIKDNLILQLRNKIFELEDKVAELEVNNEAWQRFAARLLDR